MDTLKLGLDTFGDVTSDANGVPLPYADVIRNVVAEGVLADEVGVDAITLGEHHRDDFAVSTPETVLAAIAAKTERIILSSGVTVLSSDDPVRVFQRFATIDAVSQGRAEIIMGRGSFTESFPLFGFALEDYQVLFEEKLQLFAEILKEQPVSWSGTHRAPLVNQEIYPKSHSGAMRTWVGVGGSPESVVRAANYGFPLMLAIIGGAPDRFAPYVDLYHRALDQMGKPAQPVGVHSPGHLADTDEEAIEQMWPAYQGHVRSHWA
jgi:probable LLM family oxidoreductase